MSDDIQDLSLRALAEGIRTRAISAREALQSQLARIDRVNPLINAVITLDERAHERAARADELTVSDRDALAPKLREIAEELPFEWHS